MVPCRILLARAARLGTDFARVCLLHRNQFDPEVTQPVEQPVQMGLVPDVTDEHRLVGAGEAEG